MEKLESRLEKIEKITKAIPKEHDIILHAFFEVLSEKDLKELAEKGKASIFKKEKVSSPNYIPKLIEKYRDKVLNYELSKDEKRCINVAKSPADIKFRKLFALAIKYIYEK